ncbi:MAG: FAD-dependent oxidoreductase [Flavobacteriales bacterium]
MTTTHDAFILGHGLAGAVLTAELRQRGLRVHVFDRPQAGQASPAAAGLVNPIVLRRDVPSWRAVQLLPLAEAFYRSLGTRLGGSFWHPTEVIKVFPTPNDARQWERAMASPASAPFLSRPARPELEAAGVAAPHGHGTVRPAAWLDVPHFLEAHRTALRAQGALTERIVADQEIEHGADGVRIGDRTARWLVRCEGPFATVPGLVPVKGETVVVRLPEVSLSHVVHRDVFVLPLGGEHYRVGATFQWNNVWEGPTDAAREHLLRLLRALIPVEAEVLTHLAGVRPTARDRRPIIGCTGAREAVLNGLGARGVLLAPWCAAHLADHLFLGLPLDPEVDASRFASTSS